MEKRDRVIFKLLLNTPEIRLIFWYTFIRYETGFDYECAKLIQAIFVTTVQMTWKQMT